MKKIIFILCVILFLFFHKKIVTFFVTSNSVGSSYFFENKKILKYFILDRNTLAMISNAKGVVDDYILNDRRNKNISYNGLFNPSKYSKVDTLITSEDINSLNYIDTKEHNQKFINTNTILNFIKSGGRDNSRYDSVTNIKGFHPSLYKILKTSNSFFSTLKEPVNVECTPIFNNGNLYFTTAFNTFVCYNIDKNKVDFELKFPDIPARRGFLLTNPDSSIHQQRIYFQVSSYLVCVKPASGKLDKEFGNNGYLDLGFGTSSPVIYKNIILVGTNTPSKVHALNAKTGKKIWEINLIKDTNNINLWGASPWSGYLVDFKRASLIVTTGNPKPSLFGGDRKGKNLYSNCVLSINILNGKVNWYTQEVTHDLWDYDIPSAPTFSTINFKRKNVDIVIVPTKIGNLLILDRDNGKFLFGAKYDNVPNSDVPGESTSHKQLSIISPQRFIKIEFNPNDFRNDLSPKMQTKIKNQDLIFGNFQPPSLKKTLVTYGLHGGAEWPGLALDIKNKNVFIPINNFPWKLRLYLQDLSFKPINTRINEGAIYNKFCSSCHGEKRNGSYETIGEVETNYIPSLVGLIYTDRLKYLDNVKTLNSKHNSNINISTKELYELKKYLLKVDSTSLMAKSLNIESSWTQFLDENGIPVSKSPWGEIVCYDIEKGKIKWRKPLGKYDNFKVKSGQPNYGGVTLTSNGILFATGTPDKKIRAFDSNNGVEIWNYNLFAAGSAPPFTFTYKGKNFLVVNSTGGQFSQFKEKASSLYIFNF